MYMEYTIELEQKLVEDASGYIASNEQKIDAMNKPLLEVGKRINHIAFGEGKIIEVNNIRIQNRAGRGTNIMVINLDDEIAEVQYS